MKRLLLITTLLMLFSSLPAPGFPRLFIAVGEPVNPYSRIIKAVIAVESSNGTNLFNAKENAAGWFGIRPVRLKDYNEKTGKNITHAECFDYEVGKMIVK